MLTMLAVVHWSHHKLPEQRAALYAVAVDYLMESRSSQANFTSLLRREALQALALAMFDDSEGLQRSYGMEGAAKIVRKILGEADLQAARDFLEDETLFSGLLVSQTAGEVEFWHLTFQEYLAALELASTGDWRELPEEKLFADQWSEVILLLGGCLRQKNGVRAAKKLIQKVLATGHDQPTKARAVGLAGRILRDLRPYGGDPAAGTEFGPLLQEALAIFERPVPIPRSFPRSSASKSAKRSARRATRGWTTRRNSGWICPAVPSRWAPRMPIRPRLAMTSKHMAMRHPFVQ